MKAGCKLTIPTDETHNAFIYVINGTIETEGRKVITANQVALYERGKTNVTISTNADAEILMLGGKPHNEPVFAYGPFVMNNEEEIKKCYNDYRTGKMGNPDAVNH